MLLSDAIRHRLNYYIKRKGLSSLWDLYKCSGIPKSTINSLLSSKTNNLPRLSTLLHLCEGLDTNLKDFFDDDIFLDVLDTSEDTKDIK